MACQPLWVIFCREVRELCALYSYIYIFWVVISWEFFFPDFYDNKYFYLTWGSPCDVVTNVLNCEITVSEFELQSRIYVHFHWERHELVYYRAMG